MSVVTVELHSLDAVLVSESQRLPFGSLIAIEPAARRPSAGDLAVLADKKRRQRGEVSKLKREVGPRVDALHGEEVEQEAGDEHRRRGMAAQQRPQPGPSHGGHFRVQ